MQKKLQKKKREKTPRLGRIDVDERDIHFPNYAEIKTEVPIIDSDVKQFSRYCLKNDLIFSATAFALIFLGFYIPVIVVHFIFLITGAAILIFEHYRYIRIRKIKKGWQKKRLGVEYVTVTKDLGIDESERRLIKVRDKSGNEHEIHAVTDEKEHPGNNGIIIYILGFANRIYYSVFAHRDKEDIPERKIRRKAPKTAD